MKKEYNYKLNKTLYYNEEADCIEENCDKYNGKNEYKLFARKGTLFKKRKLTDSLRKEFCIPSDIKLDYIYVSKNYSWISNSNNSLLNKLDEVC